MTSQNTFDLPVTGASIAAVRDLVDYYATDEAAAKDVRLVAAPVVAAELRRIASGIALDVGIADDVAWPCARRLYRRADELDPPAGTRED